MKSIAFIPALMLLLTTGVLGSPWTQIPGRMRHVTASANYVWGVNRDDEIYKCARPCTGEWEHVPGKLVQISAGDTEVWGVTFQNQIYKRPVDGSGDGWVRVGGYLKHVSASGNGYIWGVNRNDNVYKCKTPCDGEWVQVDRKLKQVDGGHSYVYGVDGNDDVWTIAINGSGTWRHIPGKLTYITGSGRDELFGVNSVGNIFRCEKPCPGGASWKMMSGALIQVDATADVVVGVNRHDNVYKHALANERGLTQDHSKPCRKDN